MTAKIHPKEGETFGLWTVVKEVPRPNHLCTRSTYVQVRCSCGTIDVKLYANLRKGVTSGCRLCRVSKHGMSESPEWEAWRAMLKRCKKSYMHNYSLYGGRGVTVCDRWDPDKGGSFQNFFDDLGPRPAVGYHLDKEALNLDSTEYSPSTTRWVPGADNLLRKRTSKWIEHKGERKTISQWARHLGLTDGALRYRLKSGRSIDDAFYASRYKQFRRSRHA